jgi:hypothetical protein
MMPVSLYDIISEDMMILCGFNYDSSQPFIYNEVIYRVYLGLPKNDKQVLLISESKKNPKWFLRVIPSVAQNEDGYGIKEEAYESFVIETINEEYEKTPEKIRKELRGFIDKEIP